MIAAITSCTNTSNPSVMLAAGLLAKNAVGAGLTRKPWVKTSLAPGSKVVTDYLTGGGLLGDLEALGFYLVGYGCTTCIGNSGPLPDEIAAAMQKSDVVACAVLSGNRNFEGRIHPQVKVNYLASPPLVVAYALAGKMDIDLTKEPLGIGKDGKPVFLKDIWPTHEGDPRADRASRDVGDVPGELRERVRGRRELARPRHPEGRDVRVGSDDSTYVKHPPYFDGMTLDDRHAARTSRRARARDARRLGDDGPHLAGRQHRGGRARPAKYLMSPASRRRTSTPTARGAATTR